MPDFTNLPLQSCSHCTLPISFQNPATQCLKCGLYTHTKHGTCRHSQLYCHAICQNKYRFELNLELHTVRAIHMLYQLLKCSSNLKLQLNFLVSHIDKFKLAQNEKQKFQLFFEVGFDNNENAQEFAEIACLVWKNNIYCSLCFYLFFA